MNTEKIRKETNKNFRIKLNAGSISMLIGWQGLENEVGRTKAYCLCCKALASKVDIYTWRGRKGRTIRFYAK